jgi:hypothetical protein
LTEHFVAKATRRGNAQPVSSLRQVCQNRPARRESFSDFIQEGTIMKLRTLILLGAAMAAPVLYAQAPPAPSPEMQAARDAVTKQCANESACTGKTGREMFACLRTNSDKLSAPCKDALAKLPARPPAPAPAQ